MKKITIITILLYLTQSISAQPFHFGLRIGPTLNWLKTDYSETIDSTKYSLASNGATVGFTYGLMLDFNFTENYAICSGLDVAYRGGSLKYTTYKDAMNNNVTTKSFSNEYVELPLTLKLKTNEIGYMRYFIQFGGSLDINIRAHADIDSTVINNGILQKGSSSGENVYGEINPFTMSLIIGAGVEYSLQGHTQLYAGITFKNGFIDVLKDKQLDNTSYANYSAISNYLALNLGIFF